MSWIPRAKEGPRTLDATSFPRIKPSTWQTVPDVNWSCFGITRCKCVTENALGGLRSALSDTIQRNTEYFQIRKFFTSPNLNSKFTTSQKTSGVIILQHRPNSWKGGSMSSFFFQIVDSLKILLTGWRMYKHSDERPSGMNETSLPWPRTFRHDCRGRSQFPWWVSSSKEQPWKA